MDAHRTGSRPLLVWQCPTSGLSQERSVTDCDRQVCVCHSCFGLVSMCLRMLVSSPKQSFCAWNEIRDQDLLHIAGDMAALVLSLILPLQAALQFLTQVPSGFVV